MNNQIRTISKWLGSGSINIFGSPFAGKDTQGQILADLLDGSLIGGGDILRSHAEPEKIKQVLDSGGIIPSDFYIHLVLPYLSRSTYKGKPLILSSVGRRHGEEEIIIDATKKSGHEMKVVIMLNLTENDVWRRFENAKIKQDRESRADDKSEVIKTRLKKFKDSTLPVVDFYRQKNMLVEVDGSLPVGQVTDLIIAKLTEFSS